MAWALVEFELDNHDDVTVRVFQTRDEAVDAVLEYADDADWFKEESGPTAARTGPRFHVMMWPRYDFVGKLCLIAEVAN